MAGSTSVQQGTAIPHCTQDMPKMKNVCTTPFVGGGVGNGIKSHSWLHKAAYGHTNKRSTRTSCPQAQPPLHTATHLTAKLDTHRGDSSWSKLEPSSKHPLTCYSRLSQRIHMLLPPTNTPTVASSHTPCRPCPKSPCKHAHQPPMDGGCWWT